MIKGFNDSLDVQVKELEKLLRQNTDLMTILQILKEYANTNEKFKNYYVGAGCINQTVFNYLEGNKITSGIKDYDIVYFDEDTSYEAEDVIIKDLEKKLKKINVVCDIKNQARVHLWYNEKYVDKKTAVNSVEEAISRWCATVTCIGVRLEEEKMKVFAPYGLNDIFGRIIRPVKIESSKAFFEERARKWQKKWPSLKIVNW